MTPNPEPRTPSPGSVSSKWYLSHRMRFRFDSRAVLVVCLLLAVIHTWPLVTAPGTLARNDNADAELNEWILAWVAHQLPRNPARLFDGNFFYPERDTLAYSEPLIVPALMGAPLAWLGASPVLVFNIVLMLGFALTAYAGYALTYAWTGDRAAGLVTGSLFAFNTHMLTRMAHIQGIHAWGLPLALLAADRIVVHGRWRDAIWLAVWMAAMAGTSGYLVVFAAIMIAVVVVTRVPDWRHRAVAVVLRFILATVLAAVAILPVYLPYRRLGKTMGMNRPLETVAEFSASVTGYLATAGRLHSWLWSSRFIGNPVDLFFPGVLVLVLAGLAIYWAFARRASSGAAATETAVPAIDSGLTRRRIIMLLGIGAIGFVLSLGLQTPGLRLGLPRVSADAGAARGGEVRQPLSSGRRPRSPASGWRRRDRACPRSVPRSLPRRSSPSSISSRCARRWATRGSREFRRSTPSSPICRAGLSWSKCRSGRRRVRSSTRSTC